MCANMEELERVLMDQIRYAAESLSLDFDRWGEQHVSGPSLYLLIVSETNFEEYTDPLGANRWPVERCQLATESPDKFTEVARDVASSQDGANVSVLLSDSILRGRKNGTAEKSPLSGNSRRAVLVSSPTSSILF